MEANDAEVFCDLNGPFKPQRRFQAKSAALLRPTSRPQSFSTVLTSDCEPSRQVTCTLIDLVLPGTFR